MITNAGQEFLLASPQTVSDAPSDTAIPQTYEGIAFSLSPQITGDVTIQSFSNTWPLSSFVSPLPTLTALRIENSLLQTREEEGDTYYFGTATLVVTDGTNEIGVPVSIDYSGLMVQ